MENVTNKRSINLFDPILSTQNKTNEKGSTYTTKNPTLTILNCCRREICVSPRNHTTIIECYVAANSSINNITPFIPSPDNRTCSTTECSMRRWIIRVTWRWVQERAPGGIRYIQSGGEPDVFSLDGGYRAPVVVLESV